MFKRDYLKKKAISSQDPHACHQYKQSRNQVNNEIKKAKTYFTTNLELHKGNMRKTWNLINEVTVVQNIQAKLKNYQKLRWESKLLPHPSRY